MNWLNCKAPLDSPDFTSSTGPILFGSSNSESARFDSAGNFINRRTSSVNGAFATFADNNTSGAAPLLVYSAASSHGLWIRNDATSTGNYASFLYNGTIIASISGVNSTTVSYNTSSDARLKLVKARQADLSGAIRDLWVGGFRKWGNFSHTGERAEGFGVLAQQAYKVLPPGLRDVAVTKPKDANDIWMASSEPFAYLALWGVKDSYRRQDSQQKEIERLEAQLKVQAAEIADLQRTISNIRTKIVR